jgi:hypothetical protein
MAQDRPTAIELLTAIREFLERDVMNATEGRVQFHTRVAINALGMVERELAVRGDDEAERAHDRELAAQIRSGALDGELDELRARVRESVRAKLLVANPAYLDARPRG